MKKSTKNVAHAPTNVQVEDTCSRPLTEAQREKLLAMFAELAPDLPRDLRLVRFCVTDSPSNGPMYVEEHDGAIIQIGRVYFDVEGDPDLPAAILRCAEITREWRADPKAFSRIAREQIGAAQ